MLAVYNSAYAAVLMDPKGTRDSQWKQTVTFWSIKYCYIIIHWSLPSLLWHLSITMMPILFLKKLQVINHSLQRKSLAIPSHRSALPEEGTLHTLKRRAVSSRLWHTLKNQELSRERPASKYTFIFHSELLFSCHHNFGLVSHFLNTSFTC